MKLFGNPKPKEAEEPEDPGTKTVNVNLNSPNPKTGLPELDESPQLLRLMLDVLGQSCRQVAQTGWQTPLAAIQTPSGEFIQGFTQERIEMGYEEARRTLLSAPAGTERYALAWAGYTTIGGVRYETVMVQGGERGKTRGAVMGQKYKQQLPATKFQPIGNVAVLGPGDNLLTMSADPGALSKLRLTYQRIVADVDHNHSPGHENPLKYEFEKCTELILALGDLDLPYSKELQKRPDMVQVVIGQGIWATIFGQEDKEVYLSRATLVPFKGERPFPGFVEDGAIVLGYMPPIPTGEINKQGIGLMVLWATLFKVTDKA